MSTRTQYEADLAALKGSLAKMSQLSADAVEDALEALCTADAEEAKGIVKGDTEVNRMERDIEHRCMTLLLRQQPVASDLRFISAAMKVVTDVERIGDHAADIAEIVPHLAGVRKAGDPAVSRSIEMGRKAHKMLQDAMSAFAAEDEAAAKAVIDADDAVDYDFNTIKRMLAAEIAADPGKVDAALDVLMVIKYLERIGDHAVNIAEWWSSCARAGITTRRCSEFCFPLFLFLKSCCPRRAAAFALSKPRLKNFGVFSCLMQFPARLRRIIGRSLPTEGRL